MTQRRRSWWGWGWEDQALTSEQTHKLARSVAGRFGLGDLQVREPPTLDDVALPEPRVVAPAALAELCSDDLYDRASHTYGKSYRDIVRGSYAQMQNPPDLVVRPRQESDVAAVLDWAAEQRVAVIPYGAGSSVVGGTEARINDNYRGAVSLDLGELNRVLEIDRTSRSARIAAGVLGPDLEDQLRPAGLTLRHFPQSFEFSTLGGWLATRSGGHYATVYTHIDDMVASIRCVTPSGVSESRRLPGSGAGPSPDGMLLGSEGALGVITEAWMRLQDRPRWRSSAGLHFADMLTGAEAVRALSQSGLYPTNCRLLDPVEAGLSAGVRDGSALLVLGFESADHPVEGPMARAVELCADHGATLSEPPSHRGPEQDTQQNPEAVGAWRSAFVRAPYTRDALVRMCMIVETFETACTWDCFAGLFHDVVAAVEQACERLVGGAVVTCRFTHVYPDGPAPYFTVYAPGRPGDEVAIWDEVKAAASDAIIGAGGTITHHHAVGRDHMHWYRQQRPELFGRALAAAKGALDPAGICNPGVLV